MKVQIEVTAGDIKRGIPFEADLCPIAKAAKRTLHKREIRVEGGYIEIGNPEKVGGALRTLLPRNGRRFITKFDGGEPVKPIRFTIELPDSKRDKS